MIEQIDVVELGFELVKAYPHDQFFTNRYKKGVMEIDFTYEKEELLTVDLKIEETDSIPINIKDLKELDRIFNSCQQK